MFFTRRKVLGGLAASVWSFSPLARAADGPLVLKADVLGDRLGYSGASPGPLLRVRLGAALKLDFANALAEPTILAFPGLRGANASLFAGKGRIGPGEKAAVAFAPTEAGFNIYGAIIGPDPQKQLPRGLFGPLIVDERDPPQVDLETVALFSDSASALAVNGATGPAHFSAAPGARVRLRLGSVSAKGLQLSFSGANPTVVAVDGQPSEPFEPRHNQLPVAPGARFELLVDLPRDGAAFRASTLSDDGSEAPVLDFAASGAPARERPALEGLPENKRLPREIALERSRRVTLTLAGDDSGFRFEGLASGAAAFTVKRGEPVTLALVNKTAAPQTLRLTGHVARLLHERDDGWEPYWRDILAVAPGKTIHAAFVADNAGTWPLEAVAAQARNAGLTTLFRVG